MQQEKMQIEVITLDDDKPEIETTEEMIDWGDTCRVCTKSSYRMVPIYENEGAEHKLSDKIDRYLPIEVSHTDRLPLELCFQCASTLLSWHELITGCLQAEEKLFQMLDIHQNKKFHLEDQHISSSDGIVEAIKVEDGSIDIHHSIADEEMENSYPASNERKCVEASIPNELAERSVAVNEFVDEPGTVGTEFLESLSVASEETAATLICEEEESYTMDQSEESYTMEQSEESYTMEHLEVAYENVQQSSVHDETAERCSPTKQREFTTFSDTDVSLKTGGKVAHAEVSHHPISSISKKKRRTTKMLEERTNSPQTSGKLSCKKCCRQFLRESKLDRHTRNCHVDCTTEESTFSSEETRQNEAEIVNDEENAENYCLMEEAEVDKANSWEERETPKNIKPQSYLCRHCDVTVQTTKLLKQHMLDYHSDVSNAKEGRKLRIINKYLMKRARMEANGHVYYYCNSCGKNLFSTYTFVRRMKIRTEFRLTKHIVEKLYTCDTCALPFCILYDMKRHRLNRHRQRH